VLFGWGDCGVAGVRLATQKSGTSLGVVVSSVETSLQHLRALGRALKKVLRPHEFFFLNVIPLLCVRDISETETEKREG
jgi:hypothetical protein